MKLIVYHDDNYPTWWVTREVSEKITSFLKRKGFVEYNAEDLEKWMKKSLQEKKCHHSVVVFSQDIVPDRICRWWAPSSLIRTYLDCGGSIVWMGDSPCYYWGRHTSSSSKFKKWSEEKKAKVRLLEDREGRFAEIWDINGPFHVLGIMPIYMDFPSSKVQLTKHRESFGLQNLWYGLRPIIINESDRRRMNLTILARAGKPERSIPKKKAWFKEYKEERGTPFPKVISFLSKLVGLIPALIAIASAFYTLSAGFSLVVPLLFFAAAIALSIGYLVYWFLWSKEALVSAWLRNYDEYHPKSGFLRIWDCHIGRITDEMLEELRNIAISRVAIDVRRAQKKETIEA